MVPEQASQFLKIFFGPGNRLSLTEVLSGAREDEPLFSTWISTWQKEPTSPVVLPRIWPNRAVSYYALAFGDRQWRDLGVWLRAFLGPSYSDFDPRPPRLAPEDPIEQAIAALPGVRFYRFSLHAQTLPSAKKALRLLYDLGRAQPGVSWQPPPPTGRLLRNFTLALHLDDVDAARSQLDQLRTGGRLSIWNLHFLELRLLAAEGAWTQMRVSPYWSAALSMYHRPVAVTRAMIAALYHTELAVFANNNDATGALERFTDRIWPDHHTLFRSLPSNPSPPIRYSFLLAAAAAQPPRIEMRDAILERVPTGAPDRSWAEALAALCRPVVHPTMAPLAVTLQDAQAAFDADDLDRALELASQAPAGRRRLQLLLLCASAIGSLEAERTVLQAMHEAAPADRESALRNRLFRQYWDQLSAAEPEVPEDWLAWLERLHAEPDWSTAVVTAERGAEEWDVVPLRNDRGTRQRFAALLREVSSSAPEPLRNALPHLLHAFHPEGEADAIFAPIYREMMNILALDEHINHTDAQVVLELTLALLLSGLSRTEYKDLIEAIDMIWEQRRSLQWLDWMLDVLDILAQSPAADVSLRGHLLGQVIAVAASFAQRLTTHQRLLLLSFCVEFGQPSWGESFQLPPDAPVPVDPLASGLQDRTVVLYSLTESAAKRAAGLLRDRCPTVTVSLSHDYVGNSRLQALSRNADLFVIAKRSAKHAATNFIEANRPADLPTLVARGKGCSSMIFALEEYFGTN